MSNGLYPLRILYGKTVLGWMGPCAEHYVKPPHMMCCHRLSKKLYHIVPIYQSSAIGYNIKCLHIAMLYSAATSIPCTDDILYRAGLHNAIPYRNHTMLTLNNTFYNISFYTDMSSCFIGPILSLKNSVMIKEVLYGFI